MCAHKIHIVSCGLNMKPDCWWDGRSMVGKADQPALQPASCNQRLHIAAAPLPSPSSFSCPRFWWDRQLRLAMSTQAMCQPPSSSRHMQPQPVLSKVAGINQRQPFEQHGRPLPRFHQATSFPNLPAGQPHRAPQLQPMGWSMDSPLWR